MRDYLFFAFIWIIFQSSILSQTPIVPDGNGTESDPYIIDSWQKLYWISVNPSYWDKYYLQTTDIDFGDADPPIQQWNGNAGWTPIGNETTPFTGVYDGQNYEIKGLYINRNTSDRQGLFGYINGGKILKVRLTNANITGKDYVGGIVGYFYNPNFNGLVKYCGITGNISGNNYIGGIAGIVDSFANVGLSYSMAQVVGNIYVGGFIGLIQNSFVTYSYSAGATNGNDLVGGFVGEVRNDFSQVYNSYSRSNINRLPGGTGTKLGGFAGKDSLGQINRCYSTGWVKFDGSTQTDKGFIGYVDSATNADMWRIENCYWDTESSGAYSTGNYFGITGKNTSQMKTESTYEFFDFEDIWYLPTNDYPIILKRPSSNSSEINFVNATTTQFTIKWKNGDGLKRLVLLKEGMAYPFYPDMPQDNQSYNASSDWANKGDQLGTSGYYCVYNGSGDFVTVTNLNAGNTYRVYIIEYFEHNSFTQLKRYMYEHIGYQAPADYYLSFAAQPSGSGTTFDPYIIDTWNKLFWITENPSSWSKVFKQTANIDLTQANPPINTWADNTGWTPIGNSSTKFTGKYDGQGYTINGLYINRSDGDFQGLFGYTNGAVIENINCTNSSVSARDYCGIIVGYNNNSQILNCSASGQISANYYIGGIAGLNNNNSTISNSQTQVSLSGTHTIGGVAGGNANNSIVTGSKSSGNISGTNYIGGIVGANNNSQINLSSSKANVNGNTVVGGAIGYSSGSNSAVASKSYCYGNVNGQDQVGGFIGSNGFNSTVSNCYSHSNVTITSGTSQNIGGFVGSSLFSTIEYCYSIGQVKFGQDVKSNKGFTGDDGGNFTACFWDIDTSQAATTGNVSGVAGKQTSEMKTQSTFTDAGWDFTNVWEIISGYYPRLKQNPDPLLPVSLSLLSAYIKGEIIALEWETSTEFNNLGFEVQRKIHNGSDWETIGFVKGAGNSNTAKKYKFEDRTHPFGNIQYRLKQIDYDGVFAYSKVLEICFEYKEALNLSQNYPNPFNPNTSITFSLPQREYVKLEVFNSNGQLIETLFEGEKEAGVYTIEYNASKLASGIYFYRLKTSSESIVKKMHLIK